MLIIGMISMIFLIRGTAMSNIDGMIESCFLFVELSDELTLSELVLPFFFCLI